MINIFSFFKNRDLVAENFENDNLIRCKYAVSRICEHYGKDREEPAPLLGLTLLEVGCGRRPLAADMALRGTETDAIDIDEDVIREGEIYASSIGAPVNFRTMNPEDLIRAQARYDIVMGMDVISFSAQPDRFLWAVSELLKPGGVFVFSDASPGFWRHAWHLWFKLTGNRRQQRRLHPKNAIPKKQLEKMLKKHKFKPQHWRGFYFSFETWNWERHENFTRRYMGIAPRK